MSVASKTLKRFFADETGATAIEYGLLAAMIAVASIVAFSALGGGLQNLFGTTSGNGGAGGVLENAASST